MLCTNKLNGHPAQAAIRCELTDSDIASALGIEIHSSSPVLALCRALVEAGHHPATPMTCWRGDILCLHVRSIGKAARLEVSPHGVGFVLAPACRTAPPMRFAALQVSSPPTAPNAPNPEGAA